MPRFPALTDTEIIKVLRRLDFQFYRQGKGSHEVWRRAADGRHTTIPRHRGRTLKRRTLKSILDDVGLSVEELQERLLA